MTTRFISLATAIVLLDVYLRSQLSSNDPLFLFASNNIAVNAVLLVIVVFMVMLSFSKKFKHWWSFAGCSAAAVLLGGLGITGFLFGQLFYGFPQIMLQLDYMFLIEAGVVFAICSLTYKHPPMPARLRLPKVTIPSLARFEFPVPKIPHPPNTGNRSNA